jgi:hypothetical protein
MWERWKLQLLKPLPCWDIQTTFETTQSKNEGRQIAIYLGLTKSSKSIKQKYKDKQILLILFYQTLRIVATIINTKFDPFQQSLKGFYNYFSAKKI